MYEQIEKNIEYKDNYKKNISAKNEGIVLQRYDAVTMNNPTYKNAKIYGISKKNKTADKDCVYVGQTLDTEWNNTKNRHDTKDNGAPWYGEIDGEYEQRKIWGAPGVSKCEITACEQWYLEDRANKGADLWNRQQCMTKSTFENAVAMNNNYQHDKAAVQIGKTWKPSVVSLNHKIW